MFVPTSTQSDPSVSFAFDNWDFENDSADGKNQFYRPAKVAYQHWSGQVSNRLQPK